MFTTAGGTATDRSRSARRARPRYRPADRVELAQRSSSDVVVSLLWDPDTGELAVAVVDASGSDFELVLASNDRPLDVFYHPYAHAAFHAFSPYGGESGNVVGEGKS